MHYLELFNTVVATLFFLCYSYQFFYMIVALAGRMKKHAEPVQHRFAVLIAARNEERVLANLLNSLKNQSYPQELTDIYVVADNCTDKTAWIARASGATVFERSDTKHVGKGFALKFLLDRIKEHASEPYDAYVVFDADNVADPGFLTEINKVYSDGFEIVTGYRNSKNYGDNWISAGNALCYLRECRLLNHPRQILGVSSSVMGTGFLFSEKALQACGGWKFFLLTEDCEFSMDNVVRGVKIGYAKDAVFYDEQPTSFRVSWRQRLRWCRGYLQVMRRYGGRLLRGVFHGDFSCFDLTMSILPAALLSAVSLAVNLVTMAVNVFTGGPLSTMLLSLGILFLQFFASLYAIGLYTTLLDWKHIHCPARKKLCYTLTFPVFMFTYLPVCIASFFIKVKWKPIEHTQNVDLETIERENKPSGK